MKVIDFHELNNGMAVLSCEMFSDSQITQMIQIDGKKYSDFEVEKAKECFSAPQTRNIVVHEGLDERPKDVIFLW